MAQETLERENKGIKGKMNRLCSTESPYGIESSGTSKYAPVYFVDRIIGWHELKELLNPQHEYFKDMGASIENFKAYQPEGKENLFLYPVVCGKDGKKLSRYNPYRKHQLSRSHTARRVNMMFELVEKYKLSGFRMAFLTLTMPKEISVYLSERKSTIDIAWRIFKTFWIWYDKRFGTGLAASVNLHTWKTEMPLEPHYHFHCLIPNYKLSMAGNDVDIGDYFQFQQQEWSRQRGGRYVPVSDNELIEVKEKWKDILLKFARKRNIKWGSQDIDLHYAYGNLNEEKGKIKLMHWFNYQGRYSLEDYTIYSNKNPKCDNPPDWLVCYENRSRTFGWWNIMRIISGKIKEHNRLNPLTGKPMIDKGKWDLWRLIDRGKMGFLDIVKGKPVYHILKGKEILFLVKNSIRYRLDENGIINLARPIY